MAVMNIGYVLGLLLSLSASCVMYYVFHVNHERGKSEYIDDLYT